MDEEVITCKCGYVLCKTRDLRYRVVNKNLKCPKCGAIVVNANKCVW